MPEVSIAQPAINRNNKQIKSLSVRRLPTVNREEIVKANDFEDLQHHRACAADRDATSGMPGLELAKFRKEAGVSVRHLANVDDDRASAVDAGEQLLKLVPARKIVFAAKLDPFDGCILQLFQRAATILPAGGVIQATFA